MRRNVDPFDKIFRNIVEFMPPIGGWRQSTINALFLSQMALSRATNSQTRKCVLD